MRVERDLGERQVSAGEFCHRILKPYAADVAVRRHARRCRELTGEMKRAIAGDFRELCQHDVIADICGNIIEDAIEPCPVKALV